MKRTDIVDAIVTQMKTILTTNGYNTNAGKYVEKDRTDPMDDSETVLIDVVAGEWESDDQSNKVRRWMNASVSFACQGPTSITVRDDLIEDIVKAIYVDITWGNLAILTEETGGAADKDTADKLYAWGEVDMRILYDTAEGEI